MLRPLSCRISLTDPYPYPSQRIFRVQLQVPQLLFPLEEEEEEEW
jgi:hypothetical protein